MSNPWVPRNKASSSEVSDAVSEFLSNGGKIKKLRAVDKTFREKPREKGAIFLADREERLLDD